MRKFAIGYGCGVGMGIIAYATHLILGMSLVDLTPIMVAAIAAPLFGIVVFDFKAFSRAAAEVSNLILGRLGHRSFGSGSLCRPHGL